MRLYTIPLALLAISLALLVQLRSEQAKEIKAEVRYYNTTITHAERLVDKAQRIITQQQQVISNQQRIIGRIRRAQVDKAWLIVR